MFYWNSILCQYLTVYAKLCFINIHMTLVSRALSRWLTYCYIMSAVQTIAKCVTSAIPRLVSLFRLCTAGLKNLMRLTIYKQMKMQYIYRIINHDRHFNCSAGQTQNVSGVDLIQLDSLTKRSVQKVFICILSF